MMRRVAVLGVSALMGCGPSVGDPVGTGSESGTSDGTVSASTTGDGPSTPGDPSSPGRPSTTAMTSAEGSTSSSTTTGAPGTTGAAQTSAAEGGSTGLGDCPDAGVYRATWIVAALDRIRIFWRDDEGGTCTWMTLVSPSKFSPYDVATPEPWSLEQVSWNESPESCDMDHPADLGENVVPEAHGTITLDPAPPQAPCMTSFDIQLQLLANPDPPVFVELCRTMLPIDGCPP